MMLGPLQIKWLEALESGRYQQGHTRLRVGDYYCCLGVAAEHVLGIEPELLSCGSYRYLGNGGFLVPASMNKIGLSEAGMYLLVAMNDNETLSFSETARAIKADPSKFFEEVR